MINCRPKVDSLLADWRHAYRSADEEKLSLARIESTTKDCEEAQRIIQSLAKEVQQQAHKRLASVVTRCLRAVFDEGAYEFKIDFESKRGKTEARLLFVRDGQEYEPLESSGGGVVDVASFALRLACLMLIRPQRRRTLILDEPLRFLHGEDNRNRFRAMLGTLSEEFDCQFIIATGLTWLQTGKIVEL